MDRYGYLWEYENRNGGYTYDSDYNPIPLNPSEWVKFKCDQQVGIGNSYFTDEHGTKLNVSYILYVPYTGGLRRGVRVKDTNGKVYTIINVTHDRIGGRVWV